uniref:Uncharacterized protein n=1 Tax=Amphimedon queenslandica TaxID=400682 RepID=A0A1X7VB74_AMPQE
MLNVSRVPKKSYPTSKIKVILSHTIVKSVPMKHYACHFLLLNHHKAMSLVTLFMLSKNFYNQERLVHIHDKTFPDFPLSLYSLSLLNAPPIKSKHSFIIPPTADLYRIQDHFLYNTGSLLNCDKRVFLQCFSQDQETCPDS